MTLIDGDRIITAQLYDDEHEEFIEQKMSIIDNINAYTNEGVTEADIVEQTRWIPVSERLPEEDTNVLCWYEYFRYGNYNKMYQTYGVGAYFGRFGWAGDITGDQARVIAWMPLPKPYQPQESEDKG